VARVIDWDKELSEEDRAWAEQRPDHPAGNGRTVAQRVRENDEKFGREAKVAKMSRSERIAELRAEMAKAQNEIERLETEQAIEDNPNVAVAGDPASGLVRDNTAIDGQKPEGAPEGSEDYSDQKYWTVTRLQEEIQGRNDDRTSQGLPALATTGKRAELVERLIQDDRELEGE
jgi:hypothetical protein